jgi:hypothetical protein
MKAPSQSARRTRSSVPPLARRFAGIRVLAVVAAWSVAACASTAGAGTSAAASAPPGPTASQALAETEVRAFMGALAVAARERDVARLAAALADDCTIELRSRIDGHERTTALTKAEYVQMLDRGYLSMRDLQAYDYRIVGMQVAIDADGRAATVHSQVSETAVMGGRASATRSEETTRVARRNGRLVAIAVTAITEAAPQ